MAYSIKMATIGSVCWMEAILSNSLTIKQMTTMPVRGGLKP